MVVSIVEPRAPVKGKIASISTVSMMLLTRRHRECSVCFLTTAKEKLMLDSFFHAHTPLVWSGHGRVLINNGTFAQAASLARSRIRTDGALSRLPKGADIRLKSMAALLDINTMLMQMNTRFPNRGLLEIVLLHKLQKNAQEGSSDVAALGGLIQQRLTKLLLDLGPSQLQRVFNMRSMRGIDRHEWERGVAGAASVVRAILDLAAVEDAHIFLPTLTEDVRWGVDLMFQAQSGGGAIMSVKTATGQSTRLVCGADECTPEEERGELIRLLRARRMMLERFGRDWQPALLLIGKEHGKSVSIEHASETSEWVRGLLERLKGSSKAA